MTADEPTETGPTETGPTETGPTVPTTTPRPTPRPPRPGPPPSRPQVVAPAPVAPNAPPSQDSARWGRVAEDGSVLVRDGETERSVGQYPGAGPDEALAYFRRKYDELVAQVALFTQRLDGGIPASDATGGLRTLQRAVAEPNAVGDLAALREAVAALEPRVRQRTEEAAAERTAARQATLQARTALVDQAEEIAGTDPARMQWKASGAALKDLFEQWQRQQRGGARLDRATEEALWRRFSHARSSFERARRQHFAALDAERDEAKAVKATIVAEAEALATSTAWGPTAGAFRDLMARWKSAPRAGRTEDDALWARFRAAQDTFFQARNAEAAQTDAEFAANLVVKEKIAAEAEALVPVTDVKAAARALRTLQDRWEDAGKVPRADVQRMEGRMRAVEQAVRDVEQAAWQRTNPEGKARAEGLAGQLQDAIADLERRIAAATDRGDSAAAASLQSELTAKQQWLASAMSAMNEFSG